jgi:hypothetical protein
MEQDIKKKDKYGITPLFDVWHNENKDLIECLVVKLKVDINKEYKYDATHLFIAFYSI